MPTDNSELPLIAYWLEQLARAGQRSAGGDLLCLALAAYTGPDGWKGAYAALASDLHARGFRLEAGAGEAARLLELGSLPAGGSAFTRSFGTIEIRLDPDGPMLAIRAVDGRRVDCELDAGALYWLRRALAPVTSDAKDEAAS